MLLIRNSRFLRENNTQNLIQNNMQNRLLLRC